MDTREIDRFVRHYVDALEAGTAAVFIGAGMSAGSGYVDWVRLLKPLAEEIDLDATRERHDLVSLAQYHVNARGRNRSLLNKVLLDEFSRDAKPNTNHEILARLPIPVYWTTNYDRLIETSLTNAKRIPDVKYTRNHLVKSVARRDAVVYKMHGDVDHPDDVVITKEDYEDYLDKRGPYVTALRGDLVSRTFLFLGFSFSDPNLDYVLARIRGEFQDNSREHYALMRAVGRKDFEDETEFNYATIKQQLLVKDLTRYGIRVLLVDEYPDVTAVLARIEALYKRKTVFISGSADEFGDWSRDEVDEFLADLGRLLISRDYRIVSGYGLGVSNALLSGATEAVYAKGDRRFEDAMTVRPFPRYVQDEQKRRSLWTQFRKDMVSKAGVALFLFGNKQSGGVTQAADGVEEEYCIARELGLDCIPVGATGYVAQELFQRESSADALANRSPAYRDCFMQLGEQAEHPTALLSRIASVLEELSRS